jgi:hypothetical protein
MTETEELHRGRILVSMKRTKRSFARVEVIASVLVLVKNPALAIVADTDRPP